MMTLAMGLVMSETSSMQGQQYAVSEAGLDSKTGPTIAEVGSKFEAGPDVVGDEYNVGTVASETGLDSETGPTIVKAGSMFEMGPGVVGDGHTV